MASNRHTCVAAASGGIMHSKPTVNLPALQAANLPTIGVEFLLENKAITEDGIADRAALLEYLSHFTPGLHPPACPGCETRTGIEWSIAHGMAHCYRCGYPCKVYHYEVPGLKDAGRLDVALWFHPAGLVKSK
jgi:hypothetical protein